MSGGLGCMLAAVGVLAAVVLWLPVPVWVRVCLLLVMAALWWLLDWRAVRQPFRARDYHGGKSVGWRPSPTYWGSLSDQDRVERARVQLALSQDRDQSDQSVASARASCVYFIEDGAGHVKVGRSTDPERRLRALQTGNAAGLRLAHVGWFADDAEARACESALHVRLGDRGVGGEWFKAAGLDYGGLLDAVSVPVDQD